MKRIYLDNAATTPLDSEVLEAMLPYLSTNFGNPSSIYSYGREAKIAIEKSRKKVAEILNTTPGEIFFTSGGTESDNVSITSAIQDLNCTHIISSELEHHAVLNTIKHFHLKDKIKLSFVNILPNGHIDLQHLEKLLKQGNEKILVSLMHANNEIGNLLDIIQLVNYVKILMQYFIQIRCKLFGHYPINLQALEIHFATGASHKFHGPKGVGIIYINNKVKISPILHGGSQERNMRAGTENVAGIVGFARALELANHRIEKDQVFIQQLKTYMINSLLLNFKDLSFNGDYLNESLYTVLNVSFPLTEKSDLLLMNLDINNICVSGGSACSSGSQIGSHVIQALNQKNRVPIRFSFSRNNTKQEIDEVIFKLKELL